MVTMELDLAASLTWLLPETILVATGLLLMVMALVPFLRRWAAPTALGASGLSALALWSAAAAGPDLGRSGRLLAFNGLLVLDPFGAVFRWAAVAVTGWILCLAIGSTEIPEPKRGECYGLLLILGASIALVALSQHLLMLYVAVESVSYLSYLLVGWLKHDQRSGEAALKYFLFGALCSGLMLYGFSLLYGLTGTLTLDGLARCLAAAPPTPLLWVALILVLAGVGFKISMAPFHLWTPDAYEGAPTPVAALLSVGPKAAGLAFLLRLLFTVVGPQLPQWRGLLETLAILTMTIGNVAALPQTNIKRLLAYSTIAHVGYMLVGPAVGTTLGHLATLLYFWTYVAMNLGAFAVVNAVTSAQPGAALTDYAGLAQRAPVWAALLSVCLLSLAGIPPLAGFIGKWYLLSAAVERGRWVLAAALVINSVAGLYYYARIIRYMYVAAPVRREPLPVALPVTLAALGAAAATLLIGLHPTPLVAWASRSLLVF